MKNLTATAIQTLRFVARQTPETTQRGWWTVPNYYTEYNFRCRRVLRLNGLTGERGVITEKGRALLAKLDANAEIKAAKTNAERVAAFKKAVTAARLLATFA